MRSFRPTAVGSPLGSESGATWLHVPSAQLGGVNISIDASTLPPLFPPATYNRPLIAAAVGAPRPMDIGAIVDHVSVTGLYAKSVFAFESPFSLMPPAT